MYVGCVLLKIDMHEREVSGSGLEGLGTAHTHIYICIYAAGRIILERRELLIFHMDQI